MIFTTIKELLLVPILEPFQQNETKFKMKHDLRESKRKRERERVES
jgi:hypothetical protein